MSILGRFRPRSGDSSTMARGDASGLVPSAGGMGRPPGPPTRTAVGSYDDLPKRPGRGAKDPGSLPQRPNPNQPKLPSKQMQASAWGDPPKRDAPTKDAPKKKASESTSSQAPSKISSYHASTSPSYQTTDEWASSVARRKGWIPD
jgi:hypothetical protein